MNHWLKWKTCAVDWLRRNQPTITVLAWTVRLSWIRNVLAEHCHLLT